MLFNNRVDLSLEFPAVGIIAPFPPVDTCTKETQDAYNELSDEFFDGVQRSVDLTSQEGWLQGVVNWLGREFGRIRAGGTSSQIGHGHTHGPGGHFHGPGGHTH